MNELRRWLAVSLGVCIPVSTVGTNAVVGLLMLSWFFSGSVKKDVAALRRNPVIWVLGIYCLVVGLGVLYTVADSEGVQYALRKSSKLLAIPFLISLFSEKKWRMRAYWFFLAAMALTLAVSLLKQCHLCTDLFSGYHVSPGRAVAFKDTNYTSLLMVMGAFVSAHLAHLYRQQKRIRWGLMILSVLTVYYLLWLGVGKTGQLLLLLLWPLFFYQAWRWKGLAWGNLGLLAVLFLALTTPSQFAVKWQETVRQFYKHKNVQNEKKVDRTTVGTRLDLFDESIILIKQRPLLGWGTGSFKKIYTEQANVVHEDALNNPHNQYLNVLIQQGGVGLLALLGLFAVLFRLSLILPALESSILQGLVLAMGLGCIGNSWITDFTSGYLFVWLVGVTVGALIIRKQKHVLHA